MENEAASVRAFRQRKKTFAWRGLLPMALVTALGCVLMPWALRNHNNGVILLANGLFFISGMIFVITAKRYYRCPVCEKVVVPLKDDGTPSEISFSIAIRPEVCPYCAARLR